MVTDPPPERVVRFGARVREVRKARRMTQESLATAVGVDRQSINRMENARHTPSVGVLFRVADALQVAPAVLLEDPESRVPPPPNRKGVPL